MKIAIKCLIFFMVLSFLGSCEKQEEINIVNIEYEGILYASPDANVDGMYIRITGSNTNDKKLQGLPRCGDAITLASQEVEIPQGADNIKDILGKKVTFRVLSELRLVGYDPIEDHNMWSGDVVITSFR